MALAIEDLSDAQHHAAHAQGLAEAGQVESVVELLDLLERDKQHEAEHEIREILGEDGHTDE